MALMNVHVKDLTGAVRKKGHDLFAAGSNADIWLGEFIDPRGKPPQVAIKIIRSALSKEEAKQLNDKLLREARLWTTLNHVNIVPLLGVLTTTDISPSSAPGLVTPYYKSGTLTDYVTNHHNLTVNDKMNLLCQVADGLAYLHTHKIIHADIKPGNILIGDGGQAVLADFGLSIVLETSGFTTRNTPGTTRYMAPELLDTQVVVRPTTATDVWAFGIAITEIFSRRKPYEGRTDAGVLVYVSVKNGTLQYNDYSADIRSGLWSGLSKCWQRNPADRVSMSELRDFVRKKRSDYAAGK